MVAVDNSNGRLLVFAGPMEAPYTVSTADFNGTILNQFSILEHLGTPQGIEVIGNEILYYTSQTTNNNIAIYSTAGTKLYSIAVPIAAEGEGMSIDEATRTVYEGARGDGVYKMSPSFVTDALLGMNLIINSNAEGGAAVTDASVSRIAAAASKLLCRRPCFWGNIKAAGPISAPTLIPLPYVIH